MGDANALQLSVGVETSYGVISGVNLQRLRFKSESLKPTASDTESGEITQDRSTAAIIRTERGAGGDISSELLFGAHDPLWKNALQSPSATPADTNDTGVTATLAGSILGLGSIEDSKAVGDWVHVSGSALGNNGIYKITALGTDQITVSPPLVSDEGGLTVKHGSNLVNGSNQESLWLEKHHSDETTTYHDAPGSQVTGFSVSGERGSVIELTFSLMCQTYKDATSSSGAGYTAAPTTEPMNSIAGFAGCILGGARHKVRSLSATGENALRPRGNMGEEELSSIGNGSMKVSGGLVAYFATQAQLQAFRNDTTTDLAFGFMDSAGNIMVFDFPSVKLTDIGQVAGGKDTDIMEELSFKAFKDATEGVMMRIALISA